jgi:hypothetical protein
MPTNPFDYNSGRFPCSGHEESRRWRWDTAPDREISAPITSEYWIAHPHDFLVEQRSAS